MNRISSSCPSKEFNLAEALLQRNCHVAPKAHRVSALWVLATASFKHRETSASELGRRLDEMHCCSHGATSSRSAHECRPRHILEDMFELPKISWLPVCVQPGARLSGGPRHTRRESAKQSPMEVSSVHLDKESSGSAKPSVGTVWPELTRLQLELVEAPLHLRVQTKTTTTTWKLPWRLHITKETRIEHL